MLRGILVSTLASAITSTAVLVIGLTVFVPSRADAQTSIVQAHEFHVVDDAGHTLASLGGGSTGKADLVIFDRNGSLRTLLTEDSVSLVDQHGVTRGLWALSTNADPLDNESVFQLIDGNGNVVARLSEVQSGQAELAFADDTGILVRTDP